MDWNIEVLDMQRKRIAVLDKAYNIDYQKEKDRLSRANFTLMINDEKNQFCKPFHYIKLYENGEYIDLFRIMPSELTKDANTKEITYYCEHVLGKLLDTALFQYHEVGGIGTKTSQIINYILSKQTDWKLGKCDFTRQFQYSWENENLLSALFSTSNTTTSGGGTYGSTTSGGSTNSTTNSGGSTNTTTNYGGGKFITHDGTSWLWRSPSGTSGEFAIGNVMDADGEVGNHRHAFNDRHSHEFELPNHNHDLQIPTHKHDFSVSSHSHNFTIDSHSHSITLSNHVHDIDYGIYEGPTASKFTVTVDGKQTTLTTTADNFNIVDFLKKDGGGKIQRGWHEVLIQPNNLCKITADVMVQVFVNSRGGGNY